VSKLDRELLQLAMLGHARRLQRHDLRGHGAAKPITPLAREWSSPFGLRLPQGNLSRVLVPLIAASAVHPRLA
jgi:hypothetical protein